MKCLCSSLWSSLALSLNPRTYSFLPSSVSVTEPLSACEMGKPTATKSRYPPYYACPNLGPLIWPGLYFPAAVESLTCAGVRVTHRTSCLVSSEQNNNSNKVRKCPWLGRCTYVLSNAQQYLSLSIWVFRILLTFCMPVCRFVSVSQSVCLHTLASLHFTEKKRLAFCWLIPKYFKRSVLCILSPPF